MVLVVKSLFLDYLIPSVSYGTEGRTSPPFLPSIDGHSYGVRRNGGEVPAPSPSSLFIYYTEETMNREDGEGAAALSLHTSLRDTPTVCVEGKSGHIFSFHTKYCMRKCALPVFGRAREDCPTPKQCMCPHAVGTPSQRDVCIVWGLGSS